MSSDNQPTPETPSSDYEAMAPHWRMVRAILAGAPTMRCEAYLPRLPQENKEDHSTRMELAPFTNVDGDIASDLASKPFAKQVALSQDASPRIAGEANAAGERTGGLAENIDAQGNSLHVFSSTSFAEGVNMRLKMDEAGHVVVSDGKPVYVKDDGSEVAFDAAGTVATISRLNGEAKGHRERAEAAETSIKAFEGLTDPAAAKKALEIVANLDGKKLIDAGEVEKVKAEATRALEEKYAPSWQSATPSRVSSMAKRSAALSLDPSSSPTRSRFLPIWCRPLSANPLFCRPKNPDPVLKIGNPVH